MPGGLEGRLLREKLKGERLQNARLAMDMAMPSGMIAEGIGLSEINQQAAQTGVLNEERRRMAFQNQTAASDRQNDLQSKALEQAIRALQSTGGNKTASVNELLKRLGFASQIEPEAQMTFGSAGAAQQTPEQLKAQQAIMKAFEQMNQPQQP